MSIVSRACTPFASLNNQLQHLNKELNRCETMSERVIVREDIRLIKEELRSLESNSKQQLQQITQNGSMNQIKRNPPGNPIRIHYRLRDRAKPALCRKYRSEVRARQWLSELNSKPHYVLERVEGMKL